jgi:branched-chain amino acid transport system substrate-binding protein
MNISRVKLKSCFLAAVFLGATAAAFACSEESVSLAPTSDLPGNTIKIGVMLPLTGANDKLGWSLEQAINLALDFESGQVAGKSVKLIIEDEGDRDSAVALDKAKKLVQSDKINLMLGPVQPNIASAILPYLASIPLIDIKFTAPLSNAETRNDYVFWTAPRFQDYTYPLGTYAAGKGLKTVDSIGTDSPEGTAYTEGFVLGFQNGGGKLIQQQWVPTTYSEYKLQITSLMAADATISAILGESPRAVFLKEYQDTPAFQNVPLIMLEPNSFSPEIIQQASDSLIGTLGIQGYSPTLNNPENQKFVQAYQSKYGVLPDKQLCEAYNGMRVVIEALKATQGDTNPNNLKAALLKTRINLPTGQFLFSQARTGLQPLRVYSIQRVNGVLQWVIDKEYPAAEHYQPPAS